EGKFVLWFDEIGIEDVPYVGGKNASLGEMYQNLTKKHVNIPNGFAITAHAYRYLLEKAGIKEEIKKLINGLDASNLPQLEEVGKKVRNLIRHASFPKELEKEIVKAYYELSRKEKVKELDVAVRSSATAEDLPDASFAGQQESYLNIKGHLDLIDACKKCFASLFTNRAISYRVTKKFDHFKIALSIVVQKMVRSDLATSGIMFSIDTESGFKNVVLINSSYGLGENIVQGAVNPDEFYVFKPTLNEGYKPIISKKLGTKDIKMIYDNSGNKSSTKNISVDLHSRKKYSLNDEQVLQLAKWATIIEDHYSQKSGHFKPMDMEFAVDGRTDELYIVQARPETVQSQKNKMMYKTYTLLDKGNVIVSGKSVGSQIASGKVKVIKDVKDINKFSKGEILVTEMTDPDWEPIMKIAAAIVTNKGGRTCFSGDTKIITSKGFMSFEEIYNSNYKNLLVPSLNRDTLKIEWRKITDVMKKKSKTIQISCSQTGKIKENILELTSDHKMLNIRNSEIIDSEIQEMLEEKESILIAQNLPGIEKPSKKSSLAYLLGGLMTDGHIRLNNRHGEINFVQKPTKEKEEFIKTMNNCLKDNFNKEFTESQKKKVQVILEVKKLLALQMHIDVIQKILLQN
ncbi:MAG: phosphoenolpyruvate synthase, partial [archaeon]